jgi:hypothetical protein
MNDHVVTESQEKRIGIRAGTVIQVEMYTEEEIQERIKNIAGIRNIAKNYFLDGIRQGSYLCLSE